MILVTTELVVEKPTASAPILVSIPLYAPTNAMTAPNTLDLIKPNVKFRNSREHLNGI